MGLASMEHNIFCQHAFRFRPMMTSKCVLYKEAEIANKKRKNTENDLRLEFTHTCLEITFTSVEGIYYIFWQ